MQAGRNADFFVISATAFYLPKSSLKAQKSQVYSIALSLQTISIYFHLLSLFKFLFNNSY